MEQEAALDQRRREAEEELKFNGEPLDLSREQRETYARMPEDARERARLLRGTEAGEALIELGIIPAKAASIRPLHAQNESVSEETAALLFPREMSLTQSRLDSFIQCHFGYYCKYLMKLDEEKEASLTQMNVGTFVHRVLELYFGQNKGKPLPADEAAIRADMGM